MSCGSAATAPSWVPTPGPAAGRSWPWSGAAGGARRSRAPGLAALGKDEGAEVTSVSCGAAGSCVTGGYYSRGQIGERGSWPRSGTVTGKGDRGAGPGGPGQGGYSGVGSVSCGSAGSCAVGGYYTFRGGDQGAFVATERNGRWAKAIAVPGLGALNKAGDAEVTSVSCGSAGSCAAAVGTTPRRWRHGRVRGRRAERPVGKGDRGARPGRPVQARGCLDQPGVVRRGQQLRGRAGFNGARRDVSGQGFVAAERNGRWGKAIRVPGLEP